VNREDGVGRQKEAKREPPLRQKEDRPDDRQADRRRPIAERREANGIEFVPEAGKEEAEGSASEDHDKPRPKGEGPMTKVAPDAVFVLRRWSFLKCHQLLAAAAFCWSNQN
jgi:hypothetical protein